MNESVANLTEGHVIKTLLRFTLPFFLATLLQTLYGIVDMMVVGQFADSSAMSAVSIGGLVFAGVTTVIVGLTTGGTVLIGQFLGAGSRPDARDTAATMFTLYALVALGLTAAVIVLGAPFLRLLNTPAEAYPQAVTYVRICSIGLIFICGFNAIAAVLRGDGDSKHPLYFVMVACAVNIVGDLVLVGGLKLGAAGAAIATVLGQIVSFLSGVWFMRRSESLFDFSPKGFRIHKGKPAKLLKLGIPIALQDFLVMISFFILESVINRLGVVASAAGGVADKLFMIGVLPSSAFSASIAAMVAQNMGAGKIERASASLRVGALISFVVGVLVFFWLEFAPTSAVRIFTQDRDVILTANDYLRSYAYEYLLCSVIFPLNGLINGSGHTRFTLINNLTSTFVVRVPLIYLFYYLIENARLFHIGIALPIASAVQLLCAGIYFFSGKWKKNVVLDN